MARPHGKQITPILFCLLFSAYASCVFAQYQGDQVYARLKKRYLFVQPFGKGYIIRANTVYAFADSTGHLALPFDYKEMTPVFRNRMMLARQPGWDYYLADDNGHIVRQLSSRLQVLDSARGRFYSMIGNMEVTFDENGDQLTGGFDPALSDGSMIPFSAYTNGTWHAGLTNRYGDTLLPPIYRSVSAGTHFYAAIRNDTLFVWDRSKGLLFTAASFHDCSVLKNDFIVVKKYGAWALMSHTGRLLTGFKYLGIHDFRYDISTAPPRENGVQSWPKIVPQYAEISAGQPKGLIDAAGHEVLPTSYDDIGMNTNGWMILRKVMHEDEDLVDNNQKVMATGDAFEIAFSGPRYATISKTDINSDATTTRYYDMLQRRFIKKIPSTPAAKPQHKVALPQPSGSLPNASSPPEEEKHIGDHQDTLEINRALTILRRSGGRWGVTSATGDTILPFVYDTAGHYAYSFFFVGVGGRYAALNFEGALLTPVGMTDIPWQSLPDSTIKTKNGDVYSYKGDKLTLQLSTAKTPAMEEVLHYMNGVAYLPRDVAGLTRGLYNKRRHLLTRYHPYYTNTGEYPSSIGLVAFTDSARSFLGVVDTDGHPLVQSMPMPRRFILRAHAAIAIYDTGRADVLYRFSAGGVATDTVWMDPGQKSLVLFGTHVFTSHGADYIEPYNYGGVNLAFFKPGYGKGVITHRTGRAIFSSGQEQVVDADYATLVKVNGKWELLDAKDSMVLPPVYDSIAYPQDNRFMLVKDGHAGLYEWWSKRMYPPVYDYLGYPGSLANRFFVVKQGGRYEIVADSNHIISSGWDSITHLSYSWIVGLPAFKGGVLYRLYPTAGDTLLTVPDNSVASGITYTEYYEDGTALATHNGRTGVYDRAHKAWLVPPRYNNIKKEEDYYVGHTASDTSGDTYMYDSKGRLMFRIHGNYSPQRIYGYDQWFMPGWYATPIVNDRGKIIVPDSFKTAFTVEYAGRHLYQAMTTSDKRALFDSSGRMTIPAILDYVEDDSWMYSGYFLVSQGDLRGLVNPRGRLITPIIYHDIFPGRKVEDKQSEISGLILSALISRPDPAELRPYFIVYQKEGSATGVIDSTGRVLIPCTYDSISQVHDGKIAVAKKSGKWGLISLKNKPVTPFIYDSIGIFTGGRASYRRGPQEGILTEDGEELPNKAH